MSMSAKQGCLTIADLEKDYLIRCLENAVKVNETLAVENSELRCMLGMEPRRERKARFNRDINKLLPN